jgi:hypothetical protein
MQMDKMALCFTAILELRRWYLRKKLPLQYDFYLAKLSIKWNDRMKIHSDTQDLDNFPPINPFSRRYRRIYLFTKMKE